MGNKDWDNYLRDILGEFKSEGETPRWDDFSRQYSPEGKPESGPDQLEDEALKETLSNYTPSEKVTGWDRIESSLDAADKVFDEEVRDKIKHYQAPSNPHSWTLFLKHFSSHKLLRAKLITLKVLESAAVILMLITLLHLGQIGQLPSLNPMAEEMQAFGTEPTVSIKAPKVNTNHNTHLAAPIPETASAQNESGTNASVKMINADGNKMKVMHSKMPTSVGSIDITNEVSPSGSSAEFQITLQDAPLTAVHIAQEEIALPTPPSVMELSIEKEETALATETPEIQTSVHATTITASLATRSVPLELSNANPIPYPTFVKAIDNSYLEFGILVQVDYNQLKMPEDRLFNEGKQIVFPLQGITSPGYGAGFTLAIGHTKWAMEAGLIYNSKSFRPGRELTVGSVVDHSNVEYEAMRMQLVSLPLQYRYRFDHKGRLKVYGMAGFGFHYIAQSDVDVMVEHNFNSLIAGEDPNNNPTLARTIRQAQRVSDDLREAAPFSSRTYISANLGAGLEYVLTDRKTIFLQTAYQYQIPNLRFSNHDGKHLLTLSLQAGVRTPLGS